MTIATLRLFFLCSRALKQLFIRFPEDILLLLLLIFLPLLLLLLDCQLLLFSAPLSFNHWFSQHLRYLCLTHNYNFNLCNVSAVSPNIFCILPDVLYISFGLILLWWNNWRARAYLYLYCNEPHTKEKLVWNLLYDFSILAVIWRARSKHSFAVQFLHRHEMYIIEFWRRVLLNTHANWCVLIMKHKYEQTAYKR